MTYKQKNTQMLVLIIGVLSIKTAQIASVANIRVELADSQKLVEFTPICSMTAHVFHNYH